MHRTLQRSTRTLGATLLLTAAVGCYEEEPSQEETNNPVTADAGASGYDAGAGYDAAAPVDAATPVDAAGPSGDAAPTQPEAWAYAKRPSRGAAIASDEQGTTLAVANRATDDVTFFAVNGKSERARVKVGDEPVSVTFSPDGKSVFVVNRAGGTVSVIADAQSAYPHVVATVAVGSEPGLAALSPSGKTLYVTSWVDGTLVLIDTHSYHVTSRLKLGGAPFAVCVTNNGDQNDADENIFVTDFYSRPLQKLKEATDGSRQARVFRIAANDVTKVASTSYLLPILVKGIEANIDAAQTQAFPNQLFSCSVHEGKVYVTAVGASPAAFNTTTDFRQNVHGLVYALDAYTGEVKQSVNLSELITPQPAPKRFAAVPNDLEFVKGTSFAYLTVQSADMVLRVDFGTTPPTAGVPSGPNFLPVGESPTGLTIVNGIAFTYNEVSRSISALDLPNQTVLNAQIPSAPLPAADSPEGLALRGQKFFNTANARWSTASWVSCASCHPSATTDNVTWSFPAGPRQTVDTSATFNADGTVQRTLNWTAIFDEVHDFELNTRGVANGVGAIVKDPGLDVANRIDFVGPGGLADPENGFNVGSVRAINDRDGVLDDWDNIEAFLKSVRSPKRASYFDGDPLAGRDVFAHAGCQNCHGGPLWTLSELYYTPVLDGDLRAITFAQAGIDNIGAVRPEQTVLDDVGFDTSVIGNDANGAPQRHLCTVRIVDTFDVDGPLARGADEIRQNGAAAQGPDGFNVPSLLNTGLGAPYFHNGAAETLEEVLDPYGAFTTHLRAGNPGFYPTEADVRNLAAFLRSIDDATPLFEVPADQRFCPVGVVPPVPGAEPAPAPEAPPAAEEPPATEY